MISGFRKKKQKEEELPKVVDEEQTLSEEEDDPAKEEVLADIEARRGKRRKKNPHFATKFLVGIALVIAGIAFSCSSFFTVDNIEVEGNKYFSDEEILNMAHAEVGHNIIYKSGKGDIVRYLEKNPYIAEARVYRKLPGTLRISVKEREQLAAVTYDAKYLIIDREGRLLRKTETEPKLTIVTGFKVKNLKLGEVVEVSNTKMFEEMLSVLKAMEDGDLYFTRIEMSDLYIKAYVYETLVVKGKYKDLKPALDKGRLKKILEELFARSIERGTVTITSDGYASFVPGV